MAQPDAPIPEGRDQIVRAGQGVRLLIADLFVFDRDRLGWRLATRTLIGFLLPLLAAHYFDLPGLVWVAFGAYLLAIGDCLDDGDDLQPLRLAAGALLGALALMSGVLAGGNLILALGGMLVWGFIAGLMGVYGNASAAMGLAVAWAYVELGLPASNHSLAHAAALGALFVLGGVVILILTYVVRIGGPFAPLKEHTAACYRALADYLAVLPAPEQPAVLSPETRVRSAIAEARRAAAAIRRSQQAASREGYRQRVLIEIADRLFREVAAWREAPSFSAPQSHDSAATLATTAHEVARAISGKLAPARVQELAAELDRVSDVEDPARALDRRIATDLSHALHALLGPVTVPLPDAAQVPFDVRLAKLFEPLMASLDRRSVAARHALRYAVVLCAAVMVFWVFPPPFGFWVPLTVTVVLKPYAGMTLARTVQRVIGTTLGILLGVMLMPLLGSPAAKLAAGSVAFFWMMAVLPFNYSLAILFLSLGVIPLEYILTPGLQQDVGLLRFAGTAIGAALGVVGGHLLWPSFERDELPALLRRSSRSMADYVLAALRSAEGQSPAAEVAEARRQAGLDTTNLQAATQRALSELGGDRALMGGVVLAATALQRLSLTANAISEAAPALAPQHPELSDARDAVEAALHGLAEGTAAAAEPVARLRQAARRQAMDFLERELDRLASQIEILAGAMAAVHPRAPLAQKSP
jgi:uncharacterized membrane protein YccC